MDEMIKGSNTYQKGCIHTRMIDSFYSFNDSKEDLIKDNIFLKQHLKMCSRCRDRISEHEYFWNKKRAILKPKLLSEKQQEAFRSELYSVIDEAFKSIQSEDSSSPFYYKQVLRFLGQMTSGILSAQMVRIYLVFAFIGLGLKLLI